MSEKSVLKCKKKITQSLEVCLRYSCIRRGSFNEQCRNSRICWNSGFGNFGTATKKKRQLSKLMQPI